MSVEDAREFERAMAEEGLSSAELMRRAGAVVAVQAARLADGGPVVVLCGAGNNGGDGWVAADDLARHGCEVTVVCSAAPAVMRSEEARAYACRAAEMGVPVYVAPDVRTLASLLEPADVVVDACFGTGFRGELPEPIATWAGVVDEAFCGKIVSVDVPSGIDATTGMAQGPYFTADVTVTMFAAKPGLVSGMGRAAAGKVVVASLVDTDAGLEAISDAASAFMLEDRDYADVLPEIDPLADKYGRGRVLVVAGSARYPGAAVLAATAAARSGAGYVTLACPAPMAPVAQMQLPSVPVVALPADEDGSFSVDAVQAACRLAARADVVVAGPGMTISQGACEVVRGLLGTDAGLVLDADALNAVVKICAGSVEEHPQALRREAPLVLTPHRRELARLAGGDLSRTESLSGAMEVAQGLAWAVGSGDFCVVAKGPDTAVATVDSTLVPAAGPCCLATAGTGDVLAGLMGGMLAQMVAQLPEGEELDSSDLLMTVAGIDRVHSVAGLIAQRRHGVRGVVASDVAEVVGLAADELERMAEHDLEASMDEDDADDGLGMPEESQVSPAPEAISQRMAAATALDDELPDVEPEEPGTPEAAETTVFAPVGADAPAVPDAFSEAGVREVPDELEKPATTAAPARPAEPEAAEEPAGPETGEPAEGEDDSATPAADEPAEGDEPAAEEPAAEETADEPAADAEDAEPAADAEPTAAEEPAGADVPAAAAPAAEESAAPEVPAAPATATPAAAATPHAAEPDAAAAPKAPAPGQAAAVPPFLAHVAVPTAPASRELTPEEREAAELARFHEKATTHLGETPVVPPEDRPSASARKVRRRSRKSGDAGDTPAK